MLNEDETEIVVIGSRSTPLPERFPEPFRISENDGGMGEPGGFGDLMINIPEIELTEISQCTTGSAEEIAEAIRQAVAGGNPSEHVGVVVRHAAGQFGAYQNGIHTDNSPTYATAPLPEDLSTVRAIVHNHLWNSTSAPFDRANDRYPSTDDWNNLTALVGQGADPTKLSIYILDPWGTLREYRYSDRNAYLGLADAQRAAGDNLPNETNGCSGPEQ